MLCLNALCAVLQCVGCPAPSPPPRLPRPSAPTPKLPPASFPVARTGAGTSGPQFVVCVVRRFNPPFCAMLRHAPPRPPGNAAATCRPLHQAAPAELAQPAGSASWLSQLAAQQHVPMKRFPEHLWILRSCIIASRAPGLPEDQSPASRFQDRATACISQHGATW